jgi:branched-chain amino acid transport system ATP-binding protein
VNDVLAVRDLMVFYENALAINGLSLEVRAGEIVGVIGSNSAGKTTLLNTIAGLILHLRQREARRGGERITVLGQVTLDGRDLAAVGPAERVRLGIVLCRERHPVFPESSVDENLRIAGYLRPRAEARASMEQVFRMFPGLGPLRRQKAGFLSGGLQQMLAIGMALVARPRLLLLDEPLLGLAPAVQRDVVRAIRSVRDQAGITVLVAEQFARPILPMLDRGYVIENGTLTLTGSGAELMDHREVRAAYFGV